MQYLTVENVADKLKVSKKTVYRWVDSGKIEASKAGNQWRITETAINDFMEGNIVSRMEHLLDLDESQTEALSELNNEHDEQEVEQVVRDALDMEIRRRENKDQANLF